MIRNYLDHEKISVHIVGGGRDRDYGYLGFSHWSEDDRRVMASFDNIESTWPETEEDLKQSLRYNLTNVGPSYTNLKR